MDIDLLNMGVKIAAHPNTSTPYPAVMEICNCDKCKGPKAKCSRETSDISEMNIQCGRLWRRAA